MRYPAAEKLEIIRLVEQSHLSVRRTLAKIGIPPTTFYRWYDRFIEHGPEGLEDRPSSPSRVWNRIPEAVWDQIMTLAENGSAKVSHGSVVIISLRAT
jgi:transposase-like protein